MIKIRLNINKAQELFVDSCALFFGLVIAIKSGSYNTLGNIKEIINSNFWQDYINMR